MTISLDDFKNALGHFCSGVTIVTCKSENGPHGLTVSAFSSLSLDPPLILICIAKAASSHQYLVDSTHFVVNILREGQEELCMKFANPAIASTERFAGNSYRLSQIGIPVFKDSLAYLECERERVFDGGDHSIFIGRVQKAAVHGTGLPLLYYDRAFRKLINPAR